MFYPPTMTPERLLEVRALCADAITEATERGRSVGWRALDVDRIATDITAELARRGITRDTILAVSLFCGGLAGWIDATLARLIADPDPIAALDLAEQRGLDKPGAWPRAEVIWPPAEEHEHIWLPWVSGDEDIAARACAIPGDRSWLRPGDRSWLRRCPCGEFWPNVRPVPPRARIARWTSGAPAGESAALEIDFRDHLGPRPIRREVIAALRLDAVPELGRRVAFDGNFHLVAALGNEPQQLGALESLSIMSDDGTVCVARATCISGHAGPGPGSEME